MERDLSHKYQMPFKSNGIRKKVAARKSHAIQSSQTSKIDQNYCRSFISLGYIACVQGSYSVELIKFHDFFHHLFKFSMTFKDRLPCYQGLFSWCLQTPGKEPLLARKGPTIESHDFPGLENEILNFHDFLGFP